MAHLIIQIGELKNQELLNELKLTYFTNFFIEDLDISKKYGWSLNLGATYSGAINSSDGCAQESKITEWLEIDKFQ